MKSTKKHLRIHRIARQHQLIAGIIIIATIVIGIHALMGGHAQSLFASFEPETATLSSGATVQTNDNASGGKFVQYGSPSTSTPTPSNISFAKATVWQTDDMIKQNNGSFDVNNANIVAAITQDATDMQGAGIKWARWWIGPGESAATITKVATIFKQHGILMDFDVNSGHGSDAGTESGLKSWLASVVPVMAAMGEHYWEIGNEPNINYLAHGYWDTCPGVSPGSTPGQGDTVSSVASYVVRLKDGYTTIHQYDSQAFVSSAGLSFDPSYSLYCEVPSYAWTAEFIKSQYSAWNYLDCVGIHPYDTSPGGVTNNVNSMRSSFYANTSFASKPVCITEVGYWSNGYGDQTGGIGNKDENVRAAYYTAMMDGLKAAKVTTPVFWYTWYDFEQAQGYGITHYGGYTNRTYLPIYTTMKNYAP